MLSPSQISQAPPSANHNALNHHTDHPHLQHIPSLINTNMCCVPMGSMHGVISGEALGMLDNFRRS